MHLVKLVDLGFNCAKTDLILASALEKVLAQRSFKTPIHPPLVGLLDLTSGVRAWSLIN